MKYTYEYEDEDEDDDDDDDVVSKSTNVPKDTQPFPFLYMLDVYCKSNGLLTGF